MCFHSVRKARKGQREQRQRVSSICVKPTTQLHRKLPPVPSGSAGPASPWALAHGYKGEVVLWLVPPSRRKELGEGASKNCSCMGSVNDSSFRLPPLSSRGNLLNEVPLPTLKLRCFCLDPLVNSVLRSLNPLLGQPLAQRNPHQMYLPSLLETQEPEQGYEGPQRGVYGLERGCGPLPCISVWPRGAAPLPAPFHAPSGGHLSLRRARPC